MGISLIGKISDDEVLLSTSEAAEFTSYSITTLNTYRKLGKGPKYFSRDRKVLYRLSDLKKWLEEKA